MISDLDNFTACVVAVKTEWSEHDNNTWHRHFIISRSPDLVPANGLSTEDFFGSAESGGVIYTLNSKYPCEDCCIDADDFVEYLADYLSNAAEVASWYLQLNHPCEFDLRLFGAETEFNDLPCGVDNFFKYVD